jgi:hypothetical protein
MREHPVLVNLPNRLHHTTRIRSLDHLAALDENLNRIAAPTYAVSCFDAWSSPSIYALRCLSPFAYTRTYTMSRSSAAQVTLAIATAFEFLLVTALVILFICANPDGFRTAPWETRGSKEWASDEESPAAPIVWDQRSALLLNAGKSRLTQTV